MAQRPRALEPQLSPGHLLGAHLRTLREAADLSQAQLGDLVYCSRDLIRKIETAERRPNRDLIARCDELLDAEGRLIDLYTATERTGRDFAPRDSGIALASMPAIRRALDTDDYPPDGPTRPLDELGRAVATIVEWRLHSRYDELALAIPGLLTELHRAHLAAPGAGSVRLLIQTYRAADAIADKYHVSDLSARLIDRMRHHASAADPVDAASVAYVRGEVFMTSHDYAAGRTALEHAITGHTGVGIDHSAARGALHMRCAVLAARAGDPVDAAHHLDAADHQAKHAPDGVYRGTAFGPSSVRIHRLSAALDAGDNVAAIAVGTAWQPGPTIPAERRSHFHIDLARAHLLVGDGEESQRCLHRAVAAAPQHARSHTTVHATISSLLAATPHPDRSLQHLARWTGVDA